MSNNREQSTDSIILKERRISPLGWMTVLDIIKGILSPLDSTEIQLLNSVKERNQRDRKSHHKTAEASSLSQQDCQILPSASLYWIKYSLRLLWPPANSYSLCWAHGCKHTRIKILRDILQSHISKAFSRLCSYHTTWQQWEYLCKNTGLCNDSEFGLHKRRNVTRKLS